MVFLEEDKHVITFLRKNKNYGAKRFLKDFRDKGWTRGGLTDLLSKIDRTSSFQRLPGSGRPRTARTARTARTVDNVEQIELLVLSQEDMPQSHRTQRHLASGVGISQSSVKRIVKSDLHLQ